MRGLEICISWLQICIDSVREKRRGLEICNFLAADLSEFYTRREQTWPKRRFYTVGVTESDQKLESRRDLNLSVWKEKKLLA